MTAPNQTTVSFALPAPPLRAYITTYYMVTTHPHGHSIVDYLHPEWANIRIGLKGEWARPVAFTSPSAVMFGPTSKTLVTEPVGRTVLLGIGLLPLGWARFCEMPAIEARDAIVGLEAPLDQVLDRALSVTDPATASDFKPVMDAFFSALPRRCDEKEENLVLRAHMALMQPQVRSVEDMAALMQIGPRQMTRISAMAFGFAPKLLLRRQRFLRTLQRMRADLNKPWSQQLDDSYVDQSHFIRDFKHFMGMSPREYFKLPRDILDPAARLRTQIAGQSVQGLHSPKAPDGKEKSRAP